MTADLVRAVKRHLCEGEELIGVSLWCDGPDATFGGELVEWSIRVEVDAGGAMDGFTVSLFIDKPKSRAEVSRMLVERLDAAEPCQLSAAYLE